MELIAVSVLAFLTVIALIQLLRPLARRFGHVDRPGGRKQHLKEIPLCGGLGIVPVVMLYGGLFSDYPGMLGLGLALASITVLGVFDDRVHVPAPRRLAIEIAIVVFFMCWLEGVALYSLGPIFGGHQQVVTGGLAVGFTVFAVVSLVNGINMIDGLDGLAGSFAAMVFAILAAGAVADGSPAAPVLLFLLAGTAAFLVFNLRTPLRHSASVFLGDAGSLALGFAMVWFAVDLSQGEQPVFRPITMVWIFALPVWDTTYLVARRLMRGESPFKADRSHFHHLLLEAGMPPGIATLTWLAMAAIPAVVGLLAEALGAPEVALAIGFVLAFFVFVACSTFAWRKLVPRRGDAAEVTG
ncbi:undecaprenyl/decaprenyl-phosphate alpha-N-acetylglucosaminyl 1-phosphate transferase [Salinisphaera sp. PC39]|uniref:undecaprenyl/decaprenyl-phosphate alpha-N-acetylglucosaminyl 1-phosphate transferase n=1 Tax=Salinisphaera sp. PC39 TaxID=1304156 RepID=UPI00333F4A09